jgi:CheY-like chemotaxis protein
MLDFDSQRDLPTVLIIDDDLVSREVTATILTLDGFTVHTADSGAAALELLAHGECEPAVILMDVQMEGLSGAPLIEQLRTHSGAMIFAASASQPSDEIIAVSDGVLLKPFGAEALTSLLGKQSAQQGTLVSILPPEAAPNRAFPPGSAADGQATPEPPLPVISSQTLAQLREMMPDTAVRQIYSAILTDLAKREKALEIAFATDDAAEVRRIGHAIKGGCGMAGALQIARLGAMLESGGLESNGNHVDNSTRVLDDLRLAANHLKSMLDAELPA